MQWNSIAKFTENEREIHFESSESDITLNPQIRVSGICELGLKLYSRGLDDSMTSKESWLAAGDD